jgi:hypothetical protein
MLGNAVSGELSGRCGSVRAQLLLAPRHASGIGLSWERHLAFERGQRQVG